MEGIAQHRRHFLLVMATGLKMIEIPLPTFDEQKRIVGILEKADAIRKQRQESIQLMDILLQSVFIDMFGDPVRNSRNLPTEDLSQLAKLERGKFTPRPRVRARGVSPCI